MDKYKEEIKQEPDSARIMKIQSKQKQQLKQKIHLITISIMAYLNSCLC